MKELRYTILLLFVFSMFACSKDSDDLSLSLDEYSNSPIFTFSANEEEYLIQAGVNDFYMFTDYNQDSTSTYSFIGRFAKLASCFNNCNEELTFEISYTPAFQFPSPEIISEILTVENFDISNSNSSTSSGNVRIEYRDTNNITYKSDLLENIESTFEIISVDDYNRNENDEPTKILTITFNVELKSTESEEIIFFNNAEAVIGIAYPG